MTKKPPFLFPPKEEKSPLSYFPLKKKKAPFPVSP
jgi:hypothetical protein